MVPIYCCQFRNSHSQIYTLMSGKLQAYKEEIERYNIVVGGASGCGSRGQLYIDDSYEILKKVHNELSDEQKESNPLPRKHICRDDGTRGSSYGVSLTAGIW